MGYRKERRRYQVDIQEYMNANLREITNESIYYESIIFFKIYKKSVAPFGLLVKYLRTYGYVR